LPGLKNGRASGDGKDPLGFTMENRKLDDLQGAFVLKAKIGHDAVIYHGNSGGPLVNLRGEIVGINEIGINTMGGAIPGNLAKSAAQELIAHGVIRRSWTGLELQPLLKETAAARGILVASVFPDSPAKAAGIEPGDYLTQVNGQNIGDTPGAEIALKFC